MLDGAELVAFVPTTDLERSHDFYGGVLGLHHIETTPFANVYDVGGTTLRVTLVQQRTPAPYTVLGWQVADIAAYDRVYKALIRSAKLMDVSSAFAMEELKRTTAIPLPPHGGH